jgi:hypothetical protein
MASSLQFGLELELLLQCKKKTYSSWKALAKDVSKRLAKAGIGNHVEDSTDQDYTEWLVTQEITIPSQPSNNICKRFPGRYC